MSQSSQPQTAATEQWSEMAREAAYALGIECLADIATFSRSKATGRITLHFSQGAFIMWEPQPQKKRAKLVLPPNDVFLEQ